MHCILTSIVLIAPPAPIKSPPIVPNIKIKILPNVKTLEK
tara:strand:+ start:476 stop:595 length:120 start_codon:yes stop_codon:yes gene_type:complete